MNVWMKRGLMGAGALWLVTVIPASIRPTWTAAPFAKPNAQIVVPLEAGNLTTRLRHACNAPWFVRPVMGSAHRVRVLRTDAAGGVVRVRTLDCESYVS